MHNSYQTRNEEMLDYSAVVAVYDKHDTAEVAIRKIAEAGLDMKHFSIIGKGYHSEEQVIGFYSAGDRVKFWGSRGAYWGGLWGLLFGGLMLTVPVIGPVVVLGHLAAVVFAAVSSGVEGAVVVGGMSALSAAIFSIGIPHDSVLNYEQAIKADRFLILAHGPTSEMERAKTLLLATGPMQLDVHLDAKQPIAIAA
jgi:hypothetical protein